MIDIHQQLYKWRQVIVQEGYAPLVKKAGMRTMNWVLSNPGVYHAAGKTGRWFMLKVPFAVGNRLNAWYRQREMPEPPGESFGEWYKKNKDEQQG
jgi:L-lactate dehydrogenase complex protein LldF